MFINIINCAKLYPQLLCAKVKNINEMDNFLNKYVILCTARNPNINESITKNNIEELKKCL